MFWKLNEEGLIEGTRHERTATPFCIEQASEHGFNQFAIKIFDRGNVPTYVTSGETRSWWSRWWSWLQSRWSSSHQGLEIATNDITMENTTFSLLSQRKEKVNTDCWIQESMWCFIQCARGKLCMKDLALNIVPSSYNANDDNTFMLFELIQCLS